MKSFKQMSTWELTITHDSIPMQPSSSQVRPLLMPSITDSVMSSYGQSDIPCCQVIARKQGSFTSWRAPLQETPTSAPQTWLATTYKHADRSHSATHWTSPADPGYQERLSAKPLDSL